MFDFALSGGGAAVLLSAGVVAAAAATYRFLRRSTPASPVHGDREACNRKFDSNIVRARAHRLQGPPPIDLSNLPPPDPKIAAVLQTVTVAGVTSELEKLTGEVDTTVGGKTVRISSRNTHHGLLDTAMSLLEEEYAKLGIPTRRIAYTVRGKKLYNLEATITGVTHPDEIVLVGSHLDCTAGNVYSAEKRAPGADDDASGTIGVLNMARGIVELRNGGAVVRKTIRFLHFTGEEQGLWGSDRYSDQCARAKENIVAAYICDMIAWCAFDGNRVDIHDDINRNGSHALVEKLFRVVARYGLALTPVDTHDRAVHNRSDQAGFLDHGYKAVLISEEFTDRGFNPNYHSLRDRVHTLNIPYMVENIRMVLATVAEEAEVH